MSAAKMVADSTQGDIPEKTSAKRKKSSEKKKTKKRKSGNKKVRRRDKDTQEEEYDESDLDLENDLKPIGPYATDRTRMVEEMFHCVRGASLQRALPGVLKDLTNEELKQRCLEELEVMSKKRISRILAGDDPGSISSSGTEDEESDDEKQTEALTGIEPGLGDGGGSGAVDSTSHVSDTEESDRGADEKEEVKGQSSPESGEVTEVMDCDQMKSDEGEADNCSRENSELETNDSVYHDKGEIIETEEGDNYSEGEDRVEEEIEEEEDGRIEEEEDHQEIEEEEVDEEEEEEGEIEEGKADMSITDDLIADVQQGGQSIPAGQSLAPVLTRNQMELLELEMRARAIKAMLKSQS